MRERERALKVSAAAGVARLEALVPDHFGQAAMRSYDKSTIKSAMTDDAGVWASPTPQASAFNRLLQDAVSNPWPTTTKGTGVDFFSSPLILAFLKVQSHLSRQRHGVPLGFAPAAAPRIQPPPDGRRHLRE